MLRGLVPESAFQGKFEKKKNFLSSKIFFHIFDKISNNETFGVRGEVSFSVATILPPEPKNCLKFTTAFTWFTFEKPGRKRSHVEVSGLIVLPDKFAGAKSSFNVCSRNESG